ncbi:MAG TPA: M20/M25/M40 family metallo-hydrolase [Nitrososphaerales archaeon]|nr:M20/M25/M40 family metallo-hydrolase [Nitrososphaerales archaeon]
MVAPAADPVRLLVESLRIYSPTRKEARLATFLADEMKRLGYSNVRLDRAGNVSGEVGRGRTRLLLCGHMDTVPGRLPVRKTKEAIYGRGAADAKSPLCALLIAGARAADSGVRVTFAGVTEEEGDGAGIEQLIKTGPKFDYAVFGEPSGADRLTIGYRGRVSLQVSVHTPGGHAGSPWAHRSAFDEFTSVMARLRQYERSKAVSGDYFRSLSITPTLVTAGSYQNVIPRLCEATLDLRLPPSISSAAATTEIRSIAEEPRDGVRVQLTAGPPTEAYEADIGSTLVRAFQRSIILSLKSKPRLVRKTGTGDMNTFAHQGGAECLTYGPGPSATSHTDGEMVDTRDYLNSIAVATEAIRQLAVIGPSRPG